LLVYPRACMYMYAAPDPDNLWGPLKSPMGQEALAEGDPAFKEGRMIEALQAYQKAVGMEPLNQPTQARLRATKRALGFPGDERKTIELPITGEGIANTLVFWFELQMESDKHRGEDEDEEGEEGEVDKQQTALAPTTISTSPLEESSSSDDANQNQNCSGSHWLQACQALEEVRVAGGETMPIEAAIGEGGAEVRFSIARNRVAAPPYGERRTSVPPVDPLWVRAQQEAEQKMKKIEQLVVRTCTV
jgi:hypothetical protein